MYEFKTYQPETYLLPFWKGDTVYNETLLFVNDETEAPLLYTPDQVISVRSSDLETEFTEGEDYEVRDGKIVRIEGGRIPYFTAAEWHPATPDPNRILACSEEGFEWLLRLPDRPLWEHQIHVTYIHSDSWTGAVPSRVAGKFDRFLKKAAAGETLRVLFYGDSITTGVCSSKAIHCKPYADTWYDLVMYGLRKMFPQSKFETINTAYGGWSTNTGLEFVDERATNIHPDLMILGFGMNESDSSKEVFIPKIKGVIDKFLAGNPDTEIGLIATMLPHFRAKGFWRGQHTQEPLLRELAEGYPNVGLIPMTTMHGALLEKKRYYDMTGNNINHPNDFLARMYAMTILQCLCGYYGD